MKCGYKSLLLLVLAVPLMRTPPLALAGSATSLSSAQIALQPKDVPSGFRQVQSGYLKNDQLAKAFHTTTALMKRSGLATTYEAAFTQVQKPVGVTIANTIDHFNTPDAAQLSYRQLAHAAATGFRAYHARPLSQHGLGPEAYGLTYTWRVKGAALSMAAFLVRQGSYVAIVAMTGRADLVKQSSALHFTQIVEQRMKQAG